MIFKEKKDCEVSPLELKDFCYTKSKELFNKIKANKNFCIDRDECSISFENLREPSAVNNPQDKIEEIDVTNKEVEIYCVSPDGNRDNGLINDISLRNYVTGNGKSTVSAGTVKIHLSLINASKKQRDKAVEEAQKQVDLLAKNIATLSLSCEIPNATVTAHCYQNKDAVLGLPIGEYNKDRSAKDNLDNQVVITNDFKNYSTVAEGTLTSYVSVIDVVEDLGKFKKNKDYFKVLSETYYAEAHNSGIQNFKKKHDELTETALLNAYLNLDCYYGNKEQTIDCVTTVEDSIQDKEISFDVYNGNGYSTSATISESYFTKRLNYSPIVSQYRAQYRPDTQDPQTIYPKSPDFISNYINTALKDGTAGIEEFKFKTQITEPLKELRQNYLLTNLNCYYGNLEVKLNCGDSKNSYIPDYSTFNNVLVPEVKGYVNLVNPVTIAGNSYLNKATFELDDIFSREGSQAEAARQAFKSSMEQAYNAAAFTLDRCGYYNHTMYVYCDKGVAYNDTTKNGETAPGITNEWANTAYNGDESREWTAQYNFDKFEPRDEQIKVLISYNTFLTILSALDNNSLFDVLKTADKVEYGENFRIYSENYTGYPTEEAAKEDFKNFLTINGVPYDFDYPHVIFFIYFNNYTNVKVELPANSCNKVKDAVESSTCTTDPSIDVPYETDCLDATDYEYYISAEANCPISDYKSEFTKALNSETIYTTNSEITVTVDNTEFKIPEDSKVTCSSYSDGQNSTCNCTYVDQESGEELTITDCSKISKTVETIMKDLDSGLRLANKPASVLYNVVNYGTLNSLSYSGIESQAQADIEALNYLLPSVSCIYGNIPLRSLRCLPCTCYAQTGLSSYGMQNCAPGIDKHKYLADTPEGADNLAIILRTAMRSCSCKEIGVGCTYQYPFFTVNSCGGGQTFTFKICVPGNVEITGPSNAES